uniref:Uncharacterized protein n=1 Tax=Chromera velia CCMP2878 TaxID=1169474 RepID=A0A0G4HS47_9ALVE|eukprot:Cvel_30954.t1-p1 / transcript=Cvel_30954.t1 / gene=Cvel_30954 / organism=Chromera_velia_CCMP2878 / gene_product=hypothetical protein / transcript_product=hypothetical protein / location=Cvel_scaffold4510:4044-7433(-) / protein_length=207 / sequence_SO=supercontig / SO=protein_coding / is_pseudo=false
MPFERVCRGVNSRGTEEVRPSPDSHCVWIRPEVGKPFAFVRGGDRLIPSFTVSARWTCWPGQMIDPTCADPNRRIPASMDMQVYDYSTQETLFGSAVKLYVDGGNLQRRFKGLCTESWKKEATARIRLHARDGAGGHRVGGSMRRGAGGQQGGEEGRPGKGGMSGGILNRRDEDLLLISHREVNQIFFQPQQQQQQQGGNQKAQQQY